MMDISRLKTEIAEFTDDNDTLIKVMRSALDVLKNRKGNLSGLMNRIHNDINREQVRDILTRYRIKF